jgi:hypothetical protein
MKVWISKYALSGGIFEMEVNEPRVYSHTELISDPDNPLRYFHGDGNEWHRTQEGAFIRAEQMRLEKLRSLEKQITKLMSLKFHA